MCALEDPAWYSGVIPHEIVQCCSSHGIGREEEARLGQEEKEKRSREGNTSVLPFPSPSFTFFVSS